VTTGRPPSLATIVKTDMLALIGALTPPIGVAYVHYSFVIGGTRHATRHFVHRTAAVRRRAGGHRRGRPAPAAGRVRRRAVREVRPARASARSRARRDGVYLAGRPVRSVHPMAHPCERVMVIEDDEDLLALIEEQLVQQGIDVTAFRRGTDALEHLGRAEPLPDLVLLDMMLQDIPGAELLQRLDAEPRWRGIPVAAMSGHPQYRFGYVPRIDAFLEKPFDLELLNATLSKLCGSRRRAGAGG
jgi:CheY-like chemotaxis protein